MVIGVVPLKFTPLSLENPENTGYTDVSMYCHRIPLLIYKQNPFCNMLNIVRCSCLKNAKLFLVLGTSSKYVIDHQFNKTDQSPINNLLKMVTVS